MVFLLLPDRLNLLPSAAYLEYLEGLGQVVLYPREVYSDPTMWRNAGHLNPKGAQALTEHFIGQGIGKR